MEPNYFSYDSYGWEIAMPYSMTSNDMVSASSPYRRSPPQGDLRLSPEAPLSEAVLNINSASNLEPSPGLLQSTTREQSFETGTAACVSQLDQPGGPQVADGLGWNNRREWCAFLRGPAHPAIPSAPDAFWVFGEAGHALSQHQPRPPSSQDEVLPAAPELEAARDCFPATDPDQSFGLMQPSCYDEEFGTVDAEFIREFGQFLESQQAPGLQLKDGQTHGAFVEGHVHHTVPTPPSMVGFEGRAGADLTTWFDRQLENEWYGLQEEMSLDHWPTSDLGPDLDERCCLDVPAPDEIDEWIDFHTALPNGDMWWSIMHEMSRGAIANDKVAVEKSVGQRECVSDAQHYESSVDEVLATRSPGSRSSQTGHCYPQAPSDHLRLARKKSHKASWRPRRQARRTKRLINPRKPLIRQPKPGDSEHVRVKTITDRTGEIYTWHRRGGKNGSWHDGKKKLVEAEVILNSKPWSSMMVLRAAMEEVTMRFNDADASYVGEVDYVGKLSLSDDVAVAMCKDPDGHEGFLAEWDVEKARAS